MPEDIVRRFLMVIDLKRLSFFNTTVVDSGILWHHAPFTKEDMVSQRVDRKAVLSWSEQLDALDQRIAPHFSRSEVRRRAHDYLRTVCSPGLSVRTAGSWPRWRETQHHMASSTCSEEPAGMPMP